MSPVIMFHRLNLKQRTIAVYTHGIQNLLLNTKKLTMSIKIWYLQFHFQLKKRKNITRCLRVSIVSVHYYIFVRFATNNKMKTCRVKFNNIISVDCLRDADAKCDNMF